VNGHVNDDVNCLVIIIAIDDNNIAAVQFEIKLFNFYFSFTKVIDFIFIFNLIFIFDLILYGHIL